MKFLLTAKLQILAFFLFAAVFSGCRTASNQVSNVPASTPAVRETLLPDDAEKTFPVAAPDVNLAAPLVVSDKTEDKTLCANINEKIDTGKLADARWGVFIVSLKDGRIVCERDARKLFNPASIQKTLTAIVALDRLGADFRFKTSVYAGGAIDANGVLNGDLILYGRGAPDFQTAKTENLAAQITARGIKKITGKIIGDASFFRGEPLGDGWTWNELQWYYGAEASALTFNENQTFVRVENGTANSNSNYVNVRTATNTANADTGAGIRRGLENNDFYVYGTGKNFGARVAIHNPALIAAKNFRDILAQKGITIAGEAESRDWTAETIFDPSTANEIASVESRPLGEIVRRMNKHSVNLYAELLLRTLGKNFGRAIPGDAQLPAEIRGDEVSGTLFIKKSLIEMNAAAANAEIHDGSGLSRLNFITPETFGRALIYAAQKPFAQVFADSLPVAATDGTLGGRLGAARGKISAKTGSFTFVNSLAGYVLTDGGESFAFVGICNNEPRNQSATGIIDEIALMTARYPKTETKQ